MAVSIGDVLEVALVGDVNSQRVMTVLHYRVAVAPTEQDALVMQDDFSNLISQGELYDIETAYLACMGTNYTLKQRRVQWVYPIRYRASVLTPELPGTANGQCEAQNLAMVITKRTNFAGRRHIGSVHVPGIIASFYDNGLIATAGGTAAQGLIDVLEDQVAEDGGDGIFEPCIWHRGQQGALASNLITNWTYQSTLRVMRRRTVGLGI